MSHTQRELTAAEYRVWQAGYDAARQELGCAGLNPAAYRECVEALKLCKPFIHVLKVQGELGESVLLETIQQALAHAQGQEG